MTSRTVIGLTGGIGTGKSTAAQTLASLGAVIVDCDQLGRDVVEPGGGAHEGLIDHFGPSIVGEAGTIIRPALAKLAFADEASLAALNAITHPAIDTEIQRQIDHSPTEAVVVLDMAVLVESDLGAGMYHKVLVVESPLELRIDRLVTLRKMDRADALARIQSQATDEQRRAVADWVLTNDADIADFEAAVTQWWHREIPLSA